MQPNVIDVTFGTQKNIWINRKIYQWDKGQLLHFTEELPEGAEAQFDGPFDRETINRVIENGYVQIPDKYLQYNGKIIVYVKLIGSDHETTIRCAKIEVMQREKPGDYLSDEDEQTFRSWVQQLVNQAVDTTKASKEAAAGSAASADQSAKDAAGSAKSANASASQAESSAGAASSSARQAASSASEAAGFAAEAKEAAEKSISGGQFIAFEARDDGCLYMTKTAQADVDFKLVNGELIMEV